MDPTLIIFGIRALIRLAREGVAAFDQFERDRPALFPDGLSADFRQIDFIRTTFIPDHQDLLTGSGAFAKCWSGTAPAKVPGAMEALKLRTDRQRLIVYCNAVKAWSLYGDVDGASLDTFNTLAQRKKQMTDRLEVDGIATDCRAIPTAQGFDDKYRRPRRARNPSSPRPRNLLG